MKLITHNILMCNRKGCNGNNFPLKLVVNTWKDLDAENAQDYNPALIQRLLEKIEWNALRQTVSTLDWGMDLPEVLTPEMAQDDKVLQDLHKLLIQRQVIEGQMQCPGCERVYEIHNGIPNMLLKEDEV
eukprot:403343946